MTPHRRRTFVSLGLATLLSACATAPPLPPAAPATLPAQWSSPLPHAGDAAALQDWWSRLGDPLLPQLIAEADAGSPTLAVSAARIAQARAAAHSARAACQATLRPSGRAASSLLLRPLGSKRRP